MGTDFVLKEYLLEHFNKVYGEVIDEILLSLIKFESIKDYSASVNAEILAYDEVALRADLKAVSDEFDVVKAEYDEKIKNDSLTEEEKVKYMELNGKKEELNNKIDSLLRARSIADKNLRNISEQMFHFRSVIGLYDKMSLLLVEDNKEEAAEETAKVE